MTIYSDNAGNHFLGDCIYANHNISYRSINFLQSYPQDSIVAEIQSLATSTNITLTGISSQPDFTNYNQCTIGNFKFASDTTNGANGRFRIATGSAGLTVSWGVGSGSGSFWNTLAYLDDSTTTMFEIQQTISNDINNSSMTGATGITSGSINTGVQWAGVADGESLCLYIYGGSFDTNSFGGTFYYFGTVDAVNTNFNYYSADYKSKFIGLCLKSRTTSANYGYEARHYIANTNKELLVTGDAQYPIACSDGQTPTAQWATDFYVFDNNATLGYPAIGRVRNLLLAQGTYTIGKPVRIQGTVQPDNGFNAWLPVGQFAGKWVLMRCYSSVEL